MAWVGDMLRNFEGQGEAVIAEGVHGGVGRKNWRVLKSNSNDCLKVAELAVEVEDLSAFGLHMTW